MEAPKTLSLWFSQEEIGCKRRNIRRDILDIAKQQNPDTTGKIGLTSKKMKTATKQTEKYKNWLKGMMTSEHHFCRGYSAIEMLENVSSQVISSRKSSLFDNEDSSSDVEQIPHEQPKAGSSSDVEQTSNEQPVSDEEKGQKIPASTDWEAGQPRRSKRVRKTKIMFNL